MSKGLGQKITVKFTEKLTGDVTGDNPPLAPGDFFRPFGIAKGQGFHGAYPPNNSFDGVLNTMTYFTSVSGSWIQIDLSEPTWVHGFRWHSSNSRINGFDFQGSNDDENWELIIRGNNPNTSDWNEFISDSPKRYRYFKWLITSAYSSNARTYEIELLGATGNAGAFTVLGEEHKYVNGLLIKKEYKAISLEFHPSYSDEKHLLLTLQPLSRFNNVEGLLTVIYDQKLGNLQGRGGPVESFTRVFTPIDLEPKPNPHVEETITVSAKAQVDLSKVAYRKVYTDETITVSANVTVDFIYVGTVNP